MVLDSATPVKRRWSRSWSLVAASGLVSLSVLVAGVGLRAWAAPAPAPTEPKKAEPKKEEPKKAPQQARDPFDLLPDLDKLFENLPGGANAEQLQRMRTEMKRAHEEMKKALEMGRLLQDGALPPGGVFQGGFPGLGRLNINRTERLQEGRLGARVGKPGDTLVEQLDLPRDQGLVVESIKANSAADKAGLKAHDILLEVNGKAVPNNVEDFVKQLGEIKADKPVDVVILRKGKKETVKGLSLPEAKQVRAGGARLGLFPNVFPGTGAAAPAGPANKTVLQETNRNGDNFTAKRQDDDLTISVTGTVVEGKAVPGTIEITDGKGTTKYESLDKVPENHRPAVKKMLESVTGNAIKRKVEQ